MSEQSIGKITIADGVVVIQRNNQSIELQEGDSIYLNDIVEAKSGSVGLTFADGTTFSIDTGSQAVVDEFVYDPGNTGSMNISVLAGNFSYISGEISKMDGDVAIVTPTATLTVQGTNVAGKVSLEGGGDQIILLPNEDGTVGQVLITNQSGSILLTEAFQSTTIASAFMPPTVPVIIPEEIVLKEFGTTINTIQKTKKLAKQQAEEEEVEDPFEEEVDEEELEEMEEELEEETQPVVEEETVIEDDIFEEEPIVEEEEDQPVVEDTVVEDEVIDDTTEEEDTTTTEEEDTTTTEEEEDPYIPPPVITDPDPVIDDEDEEEDIYVPPVIEEEEDPYVPPVVEEEDEEVNEAPTFNTTSTTSIAESLSSGSTVSTMSATDPNSDTITYSISSGNDAGKFTINSSTGAITTAASLDYETTTSYTLVIAASDGTLTTTTSKTINITDVAEATQYTGTANSGTAATWGSKFDIDMILTNAWVNQKVLIIGDGLYSNSDTNMPSTMSNVGLTATAVGNNNWGNYTWKQLAEYSVVIDHDTYDATWDDERKFFDLLQTGTTVMIVGENNNWENKGNQKIEKTADLIDSDINTNNQDSITSGSWGSGGGTGAQVVAEMNVSDYNDSMGSQGNAYEVDWKHGFNYTGIFHKDYLGDGDLLNTFNDTQYNGTAGTDQGFTAAWGSDDSDAEYFGTFIGHLDVNGFQTQHDGNGEFNADLFLYAHQQNEAVTGGITTDTEYLPIGGLTTTYGWTNTNNNTKSSVEAYNLGNNIYIGGGFEHLDLVWDDSGTLTVGQYINGASTGFNVTSTAGSSPRGITFNDDGTKLYLIETVNSEKVHEYNLSTAWDTTTQSDAESDLNLSVYVGTPHSMVFNTDGTKMFISDTTGADIEELTLSTAYDVSTASIDTNDRFNVDQDSSPKGLAFNTDGTKMFVTGDANDKIYEYTLSTGWDVSTASYVDALDVSSQDNDVEGLSFTANGTRMLMAGGQNDKWYEWSLSTGYDISTATYKSSLGTADSDPQDIFFKSDGSKMFTSGDGSNTIRQFQTFMGVSADKAYVAVNSDMDGANSSDAPTIADDHYLIITADTDGDGNLYEQGDVFDLDKIFIVDDSEDFLTQDDDVVTTNSSTGVDYLSGNTYFKITPVTYANSTWNVETDNTVTLANTTNYNDYLDLTSNTDFDDINYAIIETESVLISEVVASY